MDILIDLVPRCRNMVLAESQAEQTEARVLQDKQDTVDRLPLI